MTDPAITIEAIRAARAALGSHIVTTPTLDWQADELRERLGPDTRVNLKLELFQRTGTFKPRGALTVMLALDAAQRARGVTAVSAGNHAIATAYAARTLGISARVVMLPTANPARIERCRRLGAEVEIAADGAAAFERARQIEAEEGRAFVHPFEGPRTALGTATIGLEWASQTEPLDVLICPIGGGGLCAGLATAIRLLMRERGTGDREVEMETAGAAATEAGMTRLFLNLGRRDGIRPMDVVGAIANEAKIPGKSIGQIEIMDAYTFVDVPEDVADRVVRALATTRLRGRPVRAEIARARQPSRQ